MASSSHSTRRHTSKYAVWLTYAGVAITVVWAFGVLTGTRLPYLRTEFSFNLRLFIFFSLLGLVIYLLFVHRRSSQKISAYAMSIRHLTTSERIKEDVGALFGALLVFGTIAWTSVAFPAWATQLFASEHQDLVYQVEKITERSGPVWRTVFDLTLVDPASGETVVLRLTRSRFERWRWKPGDCIFLTGRTWIFGTIIEREVRCAAPMHPSLNP